MVTSPLRLFRSCCHSLGRERSFHLNQWLRQVQPHGPGSKAHCVLLRYAAATRAAETKHTRARSPRQLVADLKVPSPKSSLNPRLPFMKSRQYTNENFTYTKTASVSGHPADDCWCNRKSSGSSCTLVAAEFQKVAPSHIVRGRDVDGGTHTWEIKPRTLAIITAATSFAQPIKAVLMSPPGDAVDKLSKQLAKYAQVTAVLRCTASDLQHRLPDNLTSQLVQLQRERGASVICGASGSSVWMDALPRLAAALDVQPLTDISEIKILIVQANAFSPNLRVRDHGSAAAFVDVESVEGNSATVWKGEGGTTGYKPMLENAKVVVAGGRGFRTRADFTRLLESLRRKLGNAARELLHVTEPQDTLRTHMVLPALLVMPTDLPFTLRRPVAPTYPYEVPAAPSHHISVVPDELSDYCLEADLYKALPELATKVPQQ